jgi:cytochrome o ubiquinol oxidase subunit II
MKKSILYSVFSLRAILKVTLGCLTLMAIASCSNIHGGVLHPAGTVAKQERTLLFDTLALMLIVVIPVIIMSFAFAWRYRASNKTSKYKPNWSHNAHLEAVWWGVPCILIVVLGIITWRSTHTLDPYRKLDVPGKPLLVEAVALRWKWLFIYPEQNIATINTLDLPKDRQVEFYITADAPMVSFFIPQLGSQIYGMAGMRTRLHLLPTRLGTYEGMNTQYNGAGFSVMKFPAHVVSHASFDKWVRAVKQGHRHLGLAEYRKISQPTESKYPAVYYSAVYPKLFKRIMAQYMMPNMRLH